MMESVQQTTSREFAFVAGLNRLADDRGAMAKLRRSIRAANPMADPNAASVLGPLLYGVHELDEPRFYLVAGLFALTQSGAARRRAVVPEKPWEGESLGQSFHRLRTSSAGESLDKRFVALLNSDPEDLPVRLRQAVRLLNSADVQIDWVRLLWDLKHFGDDDRKVQENWARDYWKAGGDQSAEEQSENSQLNNT